MTELVSILSPPRSYSSLVSTMLGQHPEAYGFPELHLFVGDTIDDVLRFHERMPVLSTDGLVRAIAELEFGAQTEETVTRAQRWLGDRRAEPTRTILRDLAARAGARIAIEKSPISGYKRDFLHRAERDHPDMRYIHLVRNPIASTRSMQAAYRDRDGFGASVAMHPARAAGIWTTIHRNIRDFTRTLPPEQWILVRGEDVLADPRAELTRICAWLGVEADGAALAAMMRPEDSPYARFGPANAPHGNDHKFLSAPAFRPKPPARIAGARAARAVATMARLVPGLDTLAEAFGYVSAAPERDDRARHEDARLVALA